MSNELIPAALTEWLAHNLAMQAGEPVAFVLVAVRPDSTGGQMATNLQNSTDVRNVLKGILNQLPDPWGEVDTIEPIERPQAGMENCVFIEEADRIMKDVAPPGLDAGGIKAHVKHVLGVGRSGKSFYPPIFRSEDTPADFAKHWQIVACQRYALGRDHPDLLERCQYQGLARDASQVARYWMQVEP